MTGGSGWNILWTGNVTGDVLKKAIKYQRINHFPGSDQLGRKDLVWRNISRMIRKFGKEFAIMTHTYVLPEDYKKFKMD